VVKNLVEKRAASARYIGKNSTKIFVFVIACFEKQATPGRGLLELLYSRILNESKIGKTFQLNNFGTQIFYHKVIRLS